MLIKSVFTIESGGSDSSLNDLFFCYIYNMREDTAESLLETILHSVWFIKHHIYFSFTKTPMTENIWSAFLWSPMGPGDWVAMATEVT